MDISELMDMAEREVVLAFAKQGDGKSRSVVHLIQDCQETGNNVVILDRGNGLAKAMREVFGRTPPENVQYYLIKEWSDLEEAMAMAFEWLGVGDWLVFEEAGKMWDFAQSEYSRRVYNKSHALHGLDLRAKAEARIADQIDEDSVDEKDKEIIKSIRRSETAGGGLSIDQDWGWIKEMHNDDLFDAAIINGTFNVLTTTSAEDLSDFDKDNPRFKDYLFINAKPAGEKLHVNRHNTVAYLYKYGEDWCWRTDMGGNEGKDRGYPLKKDEIFTDLGLIAGLRAHHKEVDEELYGPVPEPPAAKKSKKSAPSP
jgi:hypothetical protein